MVSKYCLSYFWGAFYFVTPIEHAWQYFMRSAFLKKSLLLLKTLMTQNECKHCSATGDGNYCHSCGQKYNTARISIRSILHEAFHFFTHLNHGFPYTLKKLFTSPGKMQKEYIEGSRLKY